MNRRIPRFHPDKLHPGQRVTTAHREETEQRNAPPLLSAPSGQRAEEVQVLEPLATQEGVLAANMS